MSDSKLPLAEEFKLAARRWRDYGSPDKAEKYEAVSALLRQQHEALVKAKETIKAWHGEEMWDIYDEQSPEMAAINAAIAAAEGEQS